MTAAEALTATVDGVALDLCLAGPRKPTMYVNGNFTRTLAAAVTGASGGAVVLAPIATAEGLTEAQYEVANATLYQSALHFNDDDEIDCAVFRRVA